MDNIFAYAFGALCGFGGGFALCFVLMELAVARRTEAANRSYLEKAERDHKAALSKWEKQDKEWRRQYDPTYREEKKEKA